MPLESGLESKVNVAEIIIGIGFIDFAKHLNQNRNHNMIPILTQVLCHIMMLEFKSESESQCFGQHLNQNQNHLLLKSELESESWI